MKKLLSLFIILSLTLVVFAVNGTGEGKKLDHKKEKSADHVCYKSIVMQINAFAKQEKYDEALVLLKKAKDNPNYAGHAEHIYTNLAFFNDKAKKYEENIKVWNEGLEKNVTFEIDSKKEEYKPYLKIKGFDDVVKKNAECIKKGVKAKAECDDHAEEKKVEVK